MSEPDASPSRFSVSRSVLRTDRFMNFFVRAGGVGVIAAVFGILVFIIAQVLPLFRGASVSSLPPVALGAPAGAVVGVDEYGELPFYATPEGAIVFHEVATGVTTRKSAGLPGGAPPTAFAYDARLQSLAYATATGDVIPVSVGYGVDYAEDGSRRVVAAPKAGKPVPLGEDGGVIRALWFEEGADSRLFVVRREAADGGSRLEAVRVKMKKTLGGKSRAEVGEAFALAAPGMGKPDRVLIASGADGVVVTDDRGAVHWFYDEGEGFALRQSFSPFGGAAVANVGFIFGDVSLSFTDNRGVNTVWSLHNRPADEGRETRRMWGETKRLPDAPGAPSAFARSFVNKSYLIAGPGFASLRHATTEAVRTDLTPDFPVRLAGVGAHYDTLWFIDDRGDMRRYALHDPHPEAGWRAFFGEIWYEGAEAPALTWQSTSGNDDFEPKLSLVPLLYGTLKGTFYALLFALPISLLAALYTARFMKPEVRRTVKPVIELMASLPSVVLGFIAALWLAPRVEFHVPALMLAGVALPFSAFSFGLLWTRLPARIRRFVPPGREFIAMIPVVLAVLWAAWQCGPAFERFAFGGDFPAWWRLNVGPYEQRNCLVVGFVMGFAVIPIIYTIAEDALGNVPESLVSASLALGASRWQTAWRVVLPTASAGIFSALMIGFGRAVGETMIVVMATGNTAVSEANIFTGMRTASANIAVELPEAAAGGTHYRTLFLCACCLFLLTFTVNTLAELLRRRLREKYKVV